MSQQQWKLPEQPRRTSFDCLTLETTTVPTVSPGEVLVAVKACSLNYRDLIIAQGTHPLPQRGKSVIPLSDGAGEVVAVGEGVTSFQKGDRVCALFFQDFLKGSVPTAAESNSRGGSLRDGFLCQYRCLPEHALVHAPHHLTFEEASTLPCAAVTAFNALFGHSSNVVQAGETVLCEGTGGVSVFGVQLALAAGAKVVLTSSSDDKLARVRSLVSAEKQARLTTVNYKTEPDYDREVFRVSDGEGASHVLEIGGAGTLEKAFACVKRGGMISNIGFVAGGPGVQLPDIPTMSFSKGVIYRGTMVGSREQFVALNRCLEAHGIRPAVDRVFAFDEAKEAYRYQWSASHVGKVVISCV